MHSLTVRLFDQFYLAVDGVPVATIQPGRQEAILAYLILHRASPLPRRHLAFLFWPDSSEAQAHANLRQSLHFLRRSDPAVADCLALAGRTVQWLPPGPWTADVVEFEHCLAHAAAAERDHNADAAIAALSAASDLYRGSLLPSCFDEWVLAEREHRHGQFLAVLERLTILLEERRDYVAAIAQAQRLLRHDRLHEPTYRRLMALFAVNGDHANALRTYQACVAALAGELGVPPQPATEELHARLESTFAQPASGQAGASASALASGDRLVGRRTEWTALQVTWRTALAGRPHFVLVAGEPGIGKTRLVDELLHWVAKLGHVTARARSYAVEGDLAYAPVVEWLRSPAFQAALPELASTWLGELARLLPELAGRHPPPSSALSSRLRRLHLFDAMARAVAAIRQPLLLVLDDMQWCDAETLQWLHYLLRREGGAQAPSRLLIVGTARLSELDERHPLAAMLLELRIAGRLTTIELAPLAAPETAELAALLGARPLPPAVLQQVCQASEGNPLFVVELMRHLAAGHELAASLDRPSAAAPTHGYAVTRLPPKLIAVIQGRLDLLSAGARDLAGVAAVCGRAFPYALLASASDQAEDVLAQNLDELCRRRLMREQGATAYDFAHDAIREVAYAYVGPARRRALHARVAQAIEHIQAHDLDAVSAQLAAHYQHAGKAKHAIPWYQRAARAAEARFDYTHAAELLDAALALLATLPPTEARTDLECTLLLAQIGSLTVFEGFTGPKMAKVFNRLEAIVTTIQDDRLRYLVLRELRWYAGSIGAMQVSYVHAEALLDLALRLEESDYLVEAYNALGVVCRYMGRLLQAKQHLERALDLCPDGAPLNVFINLSLILWQLGYADDARRMMADAVDAVQNPTGKFGQNPFTENVVYFIATILYRHLHDVASVAALADRLVDLGQRYDMRTAIIDGVNSKAWVAAVQGDAQAGIPRMRASIDEYLAMNHLMFQPQRLAFLSEAQLRARDNAAAGATLDEALALSRHTGEHGWDAELYRQKAELLVATGAPHEEIFGAYDEAITTAQGQAAKSLELRATTGLCHYLHHLGRSAEALQRLAPLYAWFKQGHDTPDLVEAKLLLDSLSG